MSIRIATIEDLELVTQMAVKFANSSPYKDFCTEERLGQVAAGILKADNSQMIVLLYDDSALLAGVAQPFPYGDVKMATEFIWWVSPDKRGLKAGKELLKAFEYWAKKVDCKLISLSCLDDKVGQFYEKNNYKLHERAYLKEI